MDLSYLNQIEVEKLEEYLAVAGTLDLCLSQEAVESVEEYSRKEKQLISKLSTLIEFLSQKHPADLRSFFQNHEYLSKGVVEVLQKAVQRWHVAENMAPYG